MKKILVIVTAVIFVLTSCESGEIFGGRYFGTFKNTTDNKSAYGGISFQNGSLIHYELIDNPTHITDSSLVSIDTIMTIDSLTNPDYFDTTYSYHYNYSYHDSIIHNYTNIPTDTIYAFLLNNLVIMNSLPAPGQSLPKSMSCTVNDRSTIALLIKSIPVLYDLQLCDSTQVLDQIIKQMDVTAEFKESNVNSMITFTFDNETTKVVDFSGSN